MRTYILVLLLSLCLPGQANEPLNVVFLLADDLGWTDLGSFGSSFYQTPNLDRVAASGMRFTQAYAACPVCSPTRASIMAGKYPARMQTTDYFGGRRKGRLLPAPYRDRLALEEVTVAEAFKAAGYRTGFMGKWHLGPKGFWPEDQGFDVNVGGWTPGSPRGGYFAPWTNPRLPEVPKGKHLTQHLTEGAEQFLDSAKGSPFLLYVSYYLVHTPLQAKKETVARYRERAKQMAAPGKAKWGKERRRKVRLVQDHAVYAAMIEHLDDSVGRIVAKLEQLGVADHTAIVFMSDNGGLSTSEGHPTSNLPLRAGKGWLYEGGIREPMMVVWPGRVTAGSVCDVPVTSTDFYPTLLEMAGLKSNPRQHQDGVSVVPLLTGSGATPDRDLFWHYPHYGNQGGAPSGAVRSGSHKLIEWYETGDVELYDLAEDIGEQVDLAARLPEKAGELRRRLAEWRRQVGAAMPTPNPDFKDK